MSKAAPPPRRFDYVERRWYIQTGGGPFARWIPDPSNTNTKTCRVCEEEQPFSEFHKSPVNRDGMVSKCKACCKAWNALYYQKHREERAAASKRYERENAEATLIRKQRARAKNPVKYAEDKKRDARSLARKTKARMRTARSKGMATKATASLVTSCTCSTL